MALGTAEVVTKSVFIKKLRTQDTDLNPTSNYLQILPELNDRVVVMKAVAQAANLGREQILVELADWKQDAIDIERPDLAARVDEVIVIAEALPQCY